MWSPRSSQRGKVCACSSSALHFSLSGFVGVLFLALGLLWPRLNLGAAGARVAFWFLVYSALATIAGFLSQGSGEPAARSYRWQQGVRAEAIFRKRRSRS